MLPLISVFCKLSELCIVFKINFFLDYTNQKYTNSTSNPIKVLLICFPLVSSLLNSDPFKGYFHSVSGVVSEPTRQVP